MSLRPWTSRNWKAGAAAFTAHCGDQGAVPNQLVATTDPIGATAAGSDVFQPVEAPTYGQVVRGVSLTPGS